MKPFPITVRCAVAATVCLTSAGALCACGSSSGPAARPTVTRTVTAPAPRVTPTATQTAPSAGPPACGTAELTASLGPGNGAAGSTYYPVEFTNSSSAACSLYGYPGVSFVTAAGSQVGAAASEDPVFSRRLVILGPGDTAHAALRIVDALNYPPARCDPVTVDRLKVFPPGQTGALYISLTTTGCANPAVQILAVQTVQPGNGNQ